MDALRLRHIQEGKRAVTLLEGANRIGGNDFCSFAIEQKKF
jgi:hypothetical protein